MSRIYAIIVTYHPTRENFSDLVGAIADQVEAVVVVDNGSGVEVRGWLEQMRTFREFELLLLENNVGVAAAHNLGIGKARESGADAILLLDQDSLPEPEMVSALRAALENLTVAGQSVGAVGPCHVDKRTQEPSPFVRFGFLFNRHLHCSGTAGALPIECDSLITSGTLIPISSLDRVGGLDEALFIDTVDTEWCFRAISRGYKLYGVCLALMAHDLGQGRIKTRIPFSHDVVIHPPMRLYYIVRNHILLYGRANTPLRWVSQDLPRLLFKTAVFGAIIPPRVANLSMMLEGFWDGIWGRTGAYVRD